jgi:hypothetical protein
MRALADQGKKPARKGWSASAPVEPDERGIISNRREEGKVICEPRRSFQKEMKTGEGILYFKGEKTVLFSQVRIEVLSEKR